MQDIRLVGNDGEYLNLETQAGDKYRLVLDDALRAAVRRDNSALLDTVTISPREIQDAVRAGASADEVAAKHAVPLDYVEKFALTVVDEIGHIIASAQSVRIAVEQDRYSEATQLQFREILDERLTNHKAKNVVWSASKHENLPWHVSVSFETEDGPSTAVWSFDQRKLVLSPENETAVAFSTGNFANANSTTKLRTVDEVPATVVAIEPTVIEEPKARETDERVESVASVSSIEELTRASVQETAQADEPETPAALSPTADLLEALRKKRAESEKKSPVVEEQEPVHADSIEDELETTPQPIAPSAKKGRPSMPSWDEIVFGTKADD